MRVPLFFKVLPTYFLICSLFVFPVWQRYQSHAQAAQSASIAQSKLEKTDKPKQVNFIQGKPIKIVLPTQNIDLNVLTAGYNINASEWFVAWVQANYAENTVYPNNSRGQTLIYGHWSPKVFGNTKNLKVHDIAYVHTSNKHIFKYKYVSNRQVTTEDVSIFKEFIKSKKPGLVLMTCDGTWAQNRRLMYFRLVDAV